MEMLFENKTAVIYRAGGPIGGAGARAFELSRIPQSGTATFFPPKHDGKITIATGPSVMLRSSPHVTVMSIRALVVRHRGANPRGDPLTVGAEHVSSVFEGR